MKQTKIINIFGGPSAGKTGVAWAIASELKKRHKSVEYVPEFAKELVWDERLEILKDQQYVFSNQNHRIKRLIGKVDYIITDSPILLSLIYGNQYGQKNSPAFEALVVAEFKVKKNINFIIDRNEKTFETEGRLQDLKESLKIDRKITNALDYHEIPYKKINHDNFVQVILQDLHVLK